MYYNTTSFPEAILPDTTACSSLEFPLFGSYNFSPLRLKYMLSWTFWVVASFIPVSFRDSMKQLLCK